MSKEERQQLQQQQHVQQRPQWQQQQRPQRQQLWFRRSLQQQQTQRQQRSLLQWWPWRPRHPQRQHVPCCMCLGPAQVDAVAPVGATPTTAAFCGICNHSFGCYPRCCARLGHGVCCWGQLLQALAAWRGWHVGAHPVRPLPAGWRWWKGCPCQRGLCCRALHTGPLGHLFVRPSGLGAWCCRAACKCATVHSLGSFALGVVRVHSLTGSWRTPR